MNTFRAEVLYEGNYFFLDEFEADSYEEAEDYASDLQLNWAIDLTYDEGCSTELRDARIDELLRDSEVMLTEI